MDTCFIDVTLEFLAVTFHNILYFTSVYPRSIFETRRKYNIVVYRSVHPEVNQYIDLCLKSIKECLKSRQLQCVEFLITDKNYKPILKFIFNIKRLKEYDETLDAYLVKCEQNIRAFCLKLASMDQKFKKLQEAASFTMYLHTNESTAIALATNSDLEEFPLIEIEKDSNELYSIIPLRSFTVGQYNINTYMETV